MKIFRYGLTGPVVSVVVMVGTSCGSLENVRSYNVEREQVAGDLPVSMPRYFEEDLYSTDSREELPINAIASELICTVFPQSFREVAERADVIMIGTPVESLEEGKFREHSGPPKYNFSVSDFAVDVALKGNFDSGDILPLGQDVVISEDELYQLPADHPNWHKRTLVLHTLANYRPVKKGSKYLLFLYKRQDAGDETYLPIYYALGRLNVDGTDGLSYGPSFVESDSLKIRKYAIALYEATKKNPTQNHLEQIVERSDADFPRSSSQMKPR